MSLNFYDNNFVAENQDFGNGATDPIIDTALQQLQEITRNLTTKSLAIVDDKTEEIENSSKTLESEIAKSLAKNEAALAVKINRMMASADQIPRVQKTIQTLSSDLISVNKDYENEVKDILTNYTIKLKDGSSVASSEIFAGSSEAEKLLSDLAFGLKKDVKQSIAKFLSRTFFDWTKKFEEPEANKGYGLGTFDDVMGFGNILQSFMQIGMDKAWDWLNKNTDFKTQYQDDYIDNMVKQTIVTAQNLVKINSKVTKGWVEDVLDETDHLKMALQAAGDKANSRTQEIQQTTKEEIADIKEEITETMEQLQEASSKIEELRGDYAKEMAPTQEYVYKGLGWEKHDYLTAGVAAVWAIIAIGRAIEIIPQVIESLQNRKYEIRPEIVDWARGTERITTYPKSGLQHIVRFGPVIAEAVTISALALGVTYAIGAVVAAGMVVAAIEYDIGSLAIEANQMNQDIDRDIFTHEENVDNLVEDAEKDFGTIGDEAIQLITGAAFGLQKDLKQAIADFITSELAKFKPKGPGDVDLGDMLEAIIPKSLDIGDWF